MPGYFELRNRRGEDHPLARLTNAEAKKIRDGSQAKSLRQLARETGMSKSALGRLLNHETYLDADD